VPTVEITVNGRQHVVQCGPGEESRVRQLAAYVDRRIADMVRGQPQAGDARALVLATLKIADELSDAYDEIKRLRAGLGEQSDEDRNAPAGVLEQAAQRIEAIAAALEST
jgi:cell division protein ZapA